AVAPGDIGVLEVKGPNVMKGYWRNERETARAFRAGGWFVTGDLARIDEAGYVHLVGRAKDLIISGGLNVYPMEVEEQINAMPDIAEAAVIGLPHADFGEAVTAVVVTRSGKAADEEAVIARLKARLAAFKCPKRVLHLPSLPRNAMGKVEKARLRQQFADLYMRPQRP
ncbi:MAG: malonyl-CoA synthase, partial [Alphaproteobacteria bacterium]